MRRATTRIVAWLRAAIAPPGRWQRLALALACLSVLNMYCTNQDMNKQPDAPRGDGVYRPVLARGDGHMMYLIARSTALDGDWDFDNDLRQFGDPWLQRTNPVTHRREIPHPIGPPLVWTPLIWLAELGAVIANAAGADIQLHGYTLWHQRFVFLSSALVACAAVLLARGLARAVGIGPWAATYAAIAVLLGTSLTYYATYMPAYGHALDAFASAGFLAYWAHTIGRTDHKRFAILGALLGLAMLVRMQELGLAIVLAVEGTVAIVRARQWSVVGRWGIAAAITVAVMAIAFTPQLVYWHVVYGEYFTSPQGSLYTRFGAPMILETLYGPRNGWFSTTPLAYAGVLGLVLVPRRARLVAGGLLAAIAVQVYLDSTIMDYWGMASFGQRRLCNMTLPLVVGLAALVWRCGRWAHRVPAPARHALVVVGFGIFVWWNELRVDELKGGVAAPADLVPTCCDHVPTSVRGPVTWIYDHLGNPFELPANAWFAIKHGVEIQRWDIAVGNYPLIPPAGSLADGTLWGQRGVWRIGHPGAEPYLSGGWSESFTADRPYRYTTTPIARAIVPNLMPYEQRITVWLHRAGARRATVRWDGDAVAVELGDDWVPVEFVRDLGVGEHDLEIAAEPAPLDPVPPGFATAHDPVGVAVGSVEFHFTRK